MITKSKLFNVKPRIERVEIKGMKDHVYVKVMTCLERDNYEHRVISSKGKDGTRALLVIATACDKDGRLMFTDKDLSKVQKIGADLIQPIWDKAADMNLFSDSDVKELEKN